MKSSRQHGQKVAFGICGGIAAYKAAETIRLLSKAGYEVHPILTRSAAQFIGKTTCEALSGNTCFLADDNDGSMRHISLMRQMDILLIAPLTAETLAKLAAGRGDHLLTQAYLAFRGPVLVCPAMNTAMLEHPASQRNLQTIQDDGVHIVMGESGDLACGEVGYGRMAEPELILDAVRTTLGPKLEALIGKNVLVTAGPTREALDPVRFLTNHSSGKMGFAIARAFRNAGAAVTLVHGPVQLEPPFGVTCVPVTSAQEMADEVLRCAKDQDVLVMNAAVADYTPQASEQKLKKDNFDGTIRCTRTTDILASLGKQKTPKQVLIGFAAETQNVQENAKKKLERKNLDFIFANQVGGEMGFGSDNNRLWALDQTGTFTDMGTDSKDGLATTMTHLVNTYIKTTTGGSF